MSKSRPGVKGGWRGVVGRLWGWRWGQGSAGGLRKVLVWSHSSLGAGICSGSFLS